MDAKTLFDMHKLMLGNEVIMTYSGYMSQALLTSIASVLKQQIEQDHLPRKVMRNIFSVFIEQYENVVRYSDDQIEEQGKNDVRYGIMAISKKNDSYILNCGNVIKSVERVEPKNLKQIKFLVINKKEVSIITRCYSNRHDAMTSDYFLKLKIIKQLMVLLFYNVLNCV